MRERKTNTETHSPGPIEIILNSMGESGFNQLLEYTREKLPEHYGIVNCYYRMYRTFEFTGGEEYFEFKKTFMELSNKLPRFSVYDLYINLENALVKISPDELRYPAEQFELMNFMETNHTLLNHEGIMREITWIKYVLSAFSLKNKAEIKRFTETYKNSLSPGFEETCRGLSRTLVLFLEEKYTESLKEVSFLNSTFQPVNLVIKEIKIMIHYETGDYESLEYAADTHRQFVKYKKRAKIIKSNNSFGSQVLRLFKIKESLDALKLAELKQEKVSGVFTSNEWFREKLEQTEALIQGKLTGN